VNLKMMLSTQWDRATAIACTVVGGLLLLLGWVGVSGTPFLAEQAPFIISGGVGGMFLLSVGATLWISADLRDEWRKLDRIESALVDGTLRYVHDELPLQRETDDEPDRLELAPRAATSSARPSVRTERSSPSSTKRTRAGVRHG
jgi:hypothetical protein